MTVNGRRTNLRLEPEMWDARAKIARREGCSPNELIVRVDRQHTNPSLTARARVFAMGHFRSATTNSGHERVGHDVLYSGWKDGEGVPGEP